MSCFLYGIWADSQVFFDIKINDIPNSVTGYPHIYVSTNLFHRCGLPDIMAELVKSKKIRMMGFIQDELGCKTENAAWFKNPVHLGHSGDDFFSVPEVLD